jgi:hypothetical protein
MREFVHGPAGFRRPALVSLQAVGFSASWAIGVLAAAWIVPEVSLSVTGFVAAVAVFAIGQAVLSLIILKLPHLYTSLLLGGTGLALTVVALILATVLTHGLVIEGAASWMATTVMVWLVTTISAIALAELLLSTSPGSP